MSYYRDNYELGYDAGWDACRHSAGFTIIMACMFSFITGLLAGFAISDYVL